MASDSTKVDLLYKKFIGVPDAYPGTNPASEASGSSRPRIIPSLQIFQQSIPSVAPSDFVRDTTFAPLHTNGTRYVSTAYSYIAKYEALSLVAVNPGVSYRYNANNSQTNLLSDSIPFNYDVTGSYAITVKDSANNTILSSDTTYPWIFDPDSGYLTFVGSSTLTNSPPKMTFYRYEGTFGVGTESTNDFIISQRLYVYNDVSFGSTLWVADNINTTGIVAQFDTDMAVPTNFVSTVNLGAYVNYTDLLSFNMNDVNIYTQLYVDLDVSFNSDFYVSENVYIQGDTDIDGDLTLTEGDLFITEGDLTLTDGTITATDGIYNGSLTVYGQIESIGGLLIGNTTTINDSSLNGRLLVGGQAWFDSDVAIDSTTECTSITTGALTVAGGVGITGNCIAGSVSTSSDYRIKEGVKPLDETYIIDNLRPVHYYNKTTDSEDIGFIAHEVQEIYPYLVKGKKDAVEMQSLNYNGLIGILVKEIQELKNENKIIKEEIILIKNKLH